MNGGRPARCHAWGTGCLGGVNGGRPARCHTWGAGCLLESSPAEPMPFLTPSSGDCLLCDLNLRGLVEDPVL